MTYDPFKTQPKESPAQQLSFLQSEARKERPKTKAKLKTRILDPVIKSNKVVLDKWHMIIGLTPSKSNQYKIITLKKIVKDPVTGEEVTKEFHKLGGTAKLRQYQKDFIYQATGLKNTWIDYKFTFTINVYYPRKVNDLDGCFKVILDCLQQIKTIKNDSLCYKIIAEKFIDAENPRIEFMINKYENNGN